MPKPNPGESKKDYISRFMGSEEARADFPDEKQRLAVAYSMFEKRNAGPLPYGQEHPWPKSYKCSFIEPGVVFYQDLGLCKLCGDKFECVGDDGQISCETTGETVLVKQDALARMAQSFVGKPVINVEHEDVQPSTIADGEADGIVTRVWLDEKSGWWMCEFLVWDPSTQKNCESPAFSVSCAYEPTDVDESGGEYHNIPYAEEIRDGDYTHLAIVTNPRYEGARILVNSKGGSMSWKFWEKGARKNAAPIDPKTEMVDVEGKKVPLQNLYDALEEPKPKFNDDTVLETPKGEKTLGELKKNYLNRMKQNAEGEKIKADAPADSGAGSHVEGGKDAFKHGECEHCQHPAFNAADGGEKLPDMRRENDQAEDAAKKLDEETQAKRALELEQKKNADDAAARDKMDQAEATAKKNADDEKAKADEKKNAEDKAKEEMKQAEDKAREKELIEKRNAGKRSFEALKNARESGSDGAKIMPVSVDERLAAGRKKYGSA